VRSPQAARIFFGNIFNFSDFPPNFFAMGALPAQKAGLRY
jgi:hypothetical protein